MLKKSAEGEGKGYKLRENKPSTVAIVAFLSPPVKGVDRTT